MRVLCVDWIIDEFWKAVMNRSWDFFMSCDWCLVKQELQGKCLCYSWYGFGYYTVRLKKNNKTKQSNREKYSLWSCDSLQVTVWRRGGWMAFLLRVFSSWSVCGGANLFMKSLLVATLPPQVRFIIFSNEPLKSYSDGKDILSASPTPYDRHSFSLRSLSAL